MIGAILRFDRINLAPRPFGSGVYRLLRLWRHRATTRATLRDLPPRLLRDVGMTDRDARREASLPFWK